MSGSANSVEDAADANAAAEVMLSMTQTQTAPAAPAATTVKEAKHKKKTKKKRRVLLLLPGSPCRDKAKSRSQKVVTTSWKQEEKNCHVLSTKLIGTMRTSLQWLYQGRPHPTTSTELWTPDNSNWNNVKLVTLFTANLVNNIWTRRNTKKVSVTGGLHASIRS